MRSSSFVRKSVPCILTILSLNLAAPASFAAYNFGSAATAGSEAFAVEKNFIEASLNSNAHSDLFSYQGLRRGFQMEKEKVALVNTPTHTEIVPEYTEKGLILRLRYDETALNNPKLLVKDLAILAAMKSTSGYMGSLQHNVFYGDVSAKVMAEIESPHAIAELLNNVRQGSPTAKARWVSLQARMLENVRLTNALAADMNLSYEVVNEVRGELLQQIEELNKEAIKFARKQQKTLDQWKTETKALDQLESMQEKLDDLIMKNDRKGVRQMLEAYLPWAVMEPVEVNAWKLWLEAIENPDHSKTTVAFRGLKYDTDKIQRRQTGKGEIYGFMSTVLTKNQGNYSRRLRSLTTNREKNGDIGFKGNGEVFHSVKIVDQMTAHARDPKASSFISFTYDPGVAMNFMGQDITKEVKGRTVSVPYGGMLVVKMDTRRMIPNIASMYGTEIELLAPLIIFPDEVIEYREGAFKSGEEYFKFLNEIKDKTGIDFASWRDAKDTNNQSLEKRYSNEGFAFMKQMMNTKPQAMSCSKIF
nr:hypothetical protein HAGR004_19140 [Bdellovibrio sp. HAGR004]